MSYVIDFDYCNLPDGSRGVRSFCTCGWEWSSIGMLSTWAEGSIHVNQHLRKGDPVTVEMADGPVTFNSYEEYKDFKR